VLSVDLAPAPAPSAVCHLARPVVLCCFHVYWPSILCCAPSRYHLSFLSSLSRFAVVGPPSVSSGGIAYGIPPGRNRVGATGAGFGLLYLDLILRGAAGRKNQKNSQCTYVLYSALNWLRRAYDDVIFLSRF
jgi:hypothetical protein